MTKIKDNPPSLPTTLKLRRSRKLWWTKKVKKMRKKISIIVAVAENNAIGKGNKLLWHISGDLKRFKRLTIGHHVVMGKKTYESLPVKPLPARTNVVISDIEGELIKDCKMAYSIEEAVEKLPDNEESFIIGGGSVYSQFLPFANKLYITKVHKAFDADTFFPEIDENEWKLIEKEDAEPDEKNDFSFSYLTYARKPVPSI